MNNQKRKTHALEIDHEARLSRRSKPRQVKQTYIMEKSPGKRISCKREHETSIQDAEERLIMMEAAQAFVGTVEFYKSEFGGSKPHNEAVKEALNSSEWRRSQVEGLLPQDVTWR